MWGCFHSLIGCAKHAQRARIGNIGMFSLQQIDRVDLVYNSQPIKFHSTEVASLPELDCETYTLLRQQGVMR